MACAVRAGRANHGAPRSAARSGDMCGLRLDGPAQSGGMCGKGRVQPDSSQCQQAAATFCAQTINARCLSRFHARARFDADPPPESRAGGLAVGVCRAPLAAASCPPAAGIGAEGAGRPPTRPRIPNRAVPPPLGARRACRLRARASITARQASPARHVDVASAGGVGDSPR